jgi:DNA-binding FadR family transcriptional regulator
MRENQDSTRTYYQLDFGFHLAVAEATGNRAIIEMIKLLVERSHDYIGFMDESLGISMAFNADRAMTTAEQTVAHIAAGREQEAGQAMHGHLNIVNVEIDRGFSKKPD